MRRATLSLSLFAMAALISAAQPKPEFVFDLGFEYCFDNREFDAGGETFIESSTIHAARLTPAFGVALPVSDNVTHRILAGIDIFKDMGASPTSEDLQSSVNTGLFREMTLWYGLDANLPNSTLKACAGIFPRRFSVFGSFDTPSADMPGRDIPTLFISDALRFYDSNIEGILITSSRPGSYYEVSLDWLGLFGSRRREQFIVQSYGKGSILPWLSAGWVASLHHYANSFEYSGVVDDVTVSPFLSLSLDRLFPCLDRTALTFHYIQGIHQDRRNSTGLEPAFGGQATLEIRKRNIGVKNEIYYGMGQMPYYDVPGPDGLPYGSALYRGNPFYRISKGLDWKAPGMYDRLEFYYQPVVAGFLNLRLAACLHFTRNGFEGWQQKLCLVVNLDNFRIRNRS